ncbi:protein of unknown function [Pararobbsia alpina]
MCAVSETHLELVEERTQLVADIVRGMAPAPGDAFHMAAGGLHGIVDSIPGMKKRGHGVLQSVNERTAQSARWKPRFSKRDARRGSYMCHSGSIRMSCGPHSRRGVQD